VLLGLILGVPALAGEGEPDRAFGNNGYAEIRVDGLDRVEAIVECPDGKLYIAGWGFDLETSRPHAAVARVNRNGSVDATFGSGGVAKLRPAEWREERFTGVAYAPDGGAYCVAASLRYEDTVSHVTLARFLADGTLDTTFGTAGVVEDAFLGAAVQPSVGALADGSVFVACTTVGFAENVQFGLARYTAEGRRDPRFNDGAFVTRDLDGLNGYCTDMHLGSDGTATLAGYCFDDTLQHYWAGVVRIRPDGRADTRFGGGDGQTLAQAPGMTPIAHSVAVAVDGSIAVGGTYRTASYTWGLFVSRFTADGTIDRTFGEDGFARLITEGTDVSAGDAVFGSGGALLLAGCRFQGNRRFDPAEVVLARLTPTGTLDSGFGEDGIVVGRYTQSDVYADMVALADGRVAVAGHGYPLGASFPFVAVYYPDDAPPTPAFALRAPATPIEVVRGSTSAIPIEIVRFDGHERPVRILAPASLPPKVTVQPSELVVAESSGVLQIKARRRAPLGDVDLTLTATDGERTVTETVTVRIIE
jgi:uncharacterized delta-60 repeat protein